MNKKISFITYGCKLNQSETEKMAEKLNSNYNITFEEKDGRSDIYVLNTCTVTAEAERKIRQTIRRIKRKNSNIKIIATGCYSHTDAEKLKEIGADLVLGNLEKKYIDQNIEKEGIFVDKAYWLRKQDKIEIPNFPMGNRTRVFLPIEEGCYNACTYCRIIFSRGTKIRSLDKEIIFDKISDFIDQGIKEIVLTGINLGYYGYRTDYNFKCLLKDIEKKFGTKNIRIRISSLYPDMIDEQFAKIVNESDIFENHVHLSLQHVSNDVLENMGRKYRKKDINNAFKNLRKYNENFSITADIIVGFPGETEEDFQELINFVKKNKLQKIHGFRFSARPNTKAKRLENQIPGNIKKERNKILFEASKYSSKDYILNMIGKKVKVLIENNNKGYDEYYISHKINGQNNEENNFKEVIIKQINTEGVVSDVF
ncbi:tRNA (N(6)-L-threonylcarbamoyladenosine(37)-C(2))-methylthiotransferase MtaB [Geotoga petraea]|uniref:tRNA (N(6)-L-threonylcarbamoyladenosine(37)-C(2))-methylthiotransferase MtaB n=1 Tax=Geotoga petraea TaxID=28234 RepID=A0A4Z0VZZ0_9BACT|nr:tRNA (N(6)-L-threonylcarbamoyladenosine(37)-C(2))-methylthiotransferase MtaB [Geotoga petraea]TGG87347.1 tRNA (N(6)-L-threonylcarbamoyladenosine(37)-C(2))-methylthiotransferase MtaB [Geotoga petraea]